MVAPTLTGHSAKVRLELHVEGQQYQLAQIGGDEIIFDRDTLLPGTSGEVVAYIDEHKNDGQ